LDATKAVRGLASEKHGIIEIAFVAWTCPTQPVLEARLEDEYQSGNGGNREPDTTKGGTGKSQTLDIPSLLLSFLEEILFALRKRIRGSARVVKQTDFDLVVYGLADAAGLIMINDAGHKGRREGRNDVGRKEKKRTSMDGKRYIMKVGSCACTRGNH
jgi:hypothetical protein